MELMKKLMIGLSVLILAVFIFNNFDGDSPQAEFKRQDINITYHVQEPISTKRAGIAKPSARKVSTQFHTNQ
jgi:hypothetical protein